MTRPWHEALVTFMAVLLPQFASGDMNSSRGVWLQQSISQQCATHSTWAWRSCSR